MQVQIAVLMPRKEIRVQNPLEFQLLPISAPTLQFLLDVADDVLREQRLAVLYVNRLVRLLGLLSLKA